MVKSVLKFLPSLIQIEEENNIISETGKSVSRWHGDDECKNVINESIEGLQKFFFKLSYINFLYIYMYMYM